MVIWIEDRWEMDELKDRDEEEICIEGRFRCCSQEGY